MQLNIFLHELFEYNLDANKKILNKINDLPDQQECVKFVSHLINSQYKWMARIKGDSSQTQMDWWNPLYSFEQLENELQKSTQPWLNYLSEKTEEELLTEVHFIGFDGSEFAATPKDIIVQLNFHSVHHRAQIQTMIRQQGLTPDFLDYIGTRYRRLKAE